MTQILSLCIRKSTWDTHSRPAVATTNIEQRIAIYYTFILLHLLSIVLILKKRRRRHNCHEVASMLSQRKCICIHIYYFYYFSITETLCNSEILCALFTQCVFLNVSNFEIFFFLNELSHKTMKFIRCGLIQLISSEMSQTRNCMCGERFQV